MVRLVDPAARRGPRACNVCCGVSIGCFISTGGRCQALERVQLAESLGYEAAYVTHSPGASR